MADGLVGRLTFNSSMSNPERKIAWSLPKLRRDNTSHNFTPEIDVEFSEPDRKKKHQMMNQSRSCKIDLLPASAPALVIVISKKSCFTNGIRVKKVRRARGRRLWKQEKHACGIDRVGLTVETMCSVPKWIDDDNGFFRTLNMLNTLSIFCLNLLGQIHFKHVDEINVTSWNRVAVEKLT